MPPVRCPALAAPLIVNRLPAVLLGLAVNKYDVLSQAKPPRSSTNSRPRSTWKTPPTGQNPAYLRLIEIARKNDGT
jgi:hypothetical protein